MVVDSYIEMFTTIFGWMMYNTIWGVLGATGILFLPFLGIILDNLTEAYQESDGEGSSAEPVLRQMEVQIYVALLVVFLAGSPFFELQARDVSYDPPTTLDGQERGEVTAADSETTYGSIAFLNMAEQVDVPAWWYVVMQVSKGLTHAVRLAIPEEPNYRAYIQQINLIDIDDNRLRYETNNFFRDCFVRARSKYYSQHALRSDVEEQAIQALLTLHGQEDLDYIGSRVYSALPGYYNTLRARVLVRGFTFDETRDVEWEVGVDKIPEWGKPTCKMWWEGESGGDLGLRQRLIDNLPFYSKIMSIFDSTGFELIDHDRTIKKLLSVRNDMGVWVPRDYDYAYANQSAAFDSADNFAVKLIKEISSIFSLAFLSWVFSTVLHVYLQASHMLQAFLLMMLYGLLPIALVVSRYRLSILISAGILIFTVHFWTALWAWANFFDQVLIQAVFPEVGSKSENAYAESYQKFMIINFVAGMNYFIIPLVFSMMLTVAGFTAANALEGMAKSFTHEIQSTSRSTASVGMGSMKSLGKKN